MSMNAYMRDIFLNAYMTGKTEQLTTSYVKLRKQAQQKLTPEAFAYVDGSASTESTERSNREALDAYHIVPRMMSGVEFSEFSTEREIFGRTFATPLIISPIGVQGQLHPDSDVATASAAKEVEVPFCLSSATSTAMEEVMDKAQHQEAWFQLYWPSDDDVTESLIKRAKAAGYKVLVVTLDTWTLGWRPQDIDAGYNPFIRGMGCANLFSDPVFVGKYCEGKSPIAKDATAEDWEQAALSVATQGLLTSAKARTWAELAVIRKAWGDDPIVVKGVQTVTDAARAVEAGVDGIWVSNHGGRQVDGAMGSLQALRPIAQYIRGLPTKETKRPIVVFDSGIRSGADIIKALALGADLVGIGRPYAFGLACRGQEGVEAVLKSLIADLEMNAALAGYQSVGDLGVHSLIKKGEESRL